MAKKVKFPLDMGNEVMVRSIEELKANYNAEKVTEYFLNGKLLTWLEDRYYVEEAEKIRKLAGQSESDSPAAKLGAIFGIETEEEVNVEVLEIRRRKLEKLREFTSDDEIIKNVDFVAFSQEELGDLLDEEAEVIYLCGKSFRIPLSVKNVSYIGVNKPVVTISGSGEIDLEANGIVIENCEFAEETKARLVEKDPEEEEDDDETVFDFEDEDEIVFEDDDEENDEDNDFELENVNGGLRLRSYNGSDSTITIPDNVTEIGECAFTSCYSIRNVTIPNSVTKIGEGAFSNCNSLTNINIPSSVSEIGESVFSCCEALENINIPHSVTKIGNSAFNCCTSLVNISIPDSVTEIGESAFNGCTSLKNITIPGSVTEISESAFNTCERLESVQIKWGVRKIGEMAFYGCISLKKVTIPESVTEIGDSAFAECESLSSIAIPSSVVKVDESAFGFSSGIQISYCGRNYDVEKLSEFLSDYDGAFKKATSEYNRNYGSVTGNIVDGIIGATCFLNDLFGNFR